MTRTWPHDWETRKRGGACALCGDLSPRSFHHGRASEALLERDALSRGHVVVVFRGRHVADLTSLVPDELSSYWHDIQTVAAAVERVFRPCHLNYLLLGNVAPHLHVHIVPRYLDDAAPGRLLEWTPSPVPGERFLEEVRQLKDAMRDA